MRKEATMKKLVIAALLAAVASGPTASPRTSILASPSRTSARSTGLRFRRARRTKRSRPA